MTTYAVTSTFLRNVASCTWISAGGGSLRFNPDTVLHPRIGESGAWSVGFATGITIAEAVHAELAGSTANADGTFTNAAGALRVLTLTAAGACEPDPAPPPIP